MNRESGLALLAVVGLLMMTDVARPEAPYPLAWKRQLGSSGPDYCYGLSADGQGSVYLGGYTNGSMGGPNAGESDAFVCKYSVAGGLIWTRQFGTSAADDVYGVSGDGAGSIYAAGLTYGSLAAPQAGVYDAFIARFDEAGNRLWTRQIGTVADDYCRTVVADKSGHAYIAGYTHGALVGSSYGNADVFVIKYDSAGNLLWKRQTGTSQEDYGQNVCVDTQANVYLTGCTYGSLGGPSQGYADAFVMKYDSAGSLLWTRQLGTSYEDYCYGVSVNKLGNVFIAGTTYGPLGGPNAGGADVFVSKWNDSGDLLWTRQFGTDKEDYSSGVFADDLGNVYISGWTKGSLGGPNAGSHDAFLAKYDASGSPLWIIQIGSSGGDYAEAVSADGLGRVYIAGRTSGVIEGVSQGSLDVFLVSYQVPEPSTLALFALTQVTQFKKFRALFREGIPRGGPAGRGGRRKVDV
ncbi:MAG: SBBP repeat-containing protein, partial [Planctomycetota bacterium]|nr:SBBP repeat-containing protein [Planctomycetota bacterium]